MAEKAVTQKKAETEAAEKPAVAAKPAAAKPVAAKPAAAKAPAAKTPAAKPAAVKAPATAQAKPTPAKPATAKPSEAKTLITPPPVPITAADLPTEEIGVVPTTTDAAEEKKGKKKKEKAPKLPKKPGKPKPIEKWLCLIALILSSLLAVAFLVDLFAGMPFGGHSGALDIVSFLACAVLAYLAWDTGREY